jgi:hypothetical protein
MKIENVIGHSCHCLYCYVLLLVDVSLGTHLSASWRGCWMALFVITIKSRRCALRAAASVDSNVELPERCTRALYHTVGRNQTEALAFGEDRRQKKKWKV